MKNKSKNIIVSVPALKPMSQMFIYAWLIALMVIAAYLGVHGMGFYGYNSDERMHIDIASATTLQQLLQFSHYETHPPLLYIVLHYWLKISDNINFVRSLSLIFGLALIPIYYLIGKKLNGEMMGICCAVLIAFSNGLIIQSFLVRQYPLFLFFLSLSFYYFILWRDTHKNYHLSLYAVFMLLAGLSHFSALFAITVIAASESLRMLFNKTRISDQAKWCLVNLLLAAIELAIYLAWKKIFVETAQPSDLSVLKIYAAHYMFFVTMPLLYMLYSLEYIFPNPLLSFAIIFLPLAVYKNKNSNLRFILRMAGLAFTLGFILLITNYYPFYGDRHSLWIIPFFIIPSAWIVAMACEWLLVRLQDKPNIPWQEIIAICLIIIGFNSFSPKARFFDTSEYTMPKNIWQDVSSFTDALDSKDLIINEKDQNEYFMNIYPHLGDDAYIKTEVPRIVPYKNTHIMFNPYYRRFYFNENIIDMMIYAKNHHMLDGVDTLIFTRMMWSLNPVLSLMTCTSLDKKVITFPGMDEDHEYERKDIIYKPLSMLIVSKDAFFNELISSTGKAHGCLKEYWETEDYNASHGQ